MFWTFASYVIFLILLKVINLLSIYVDKKLNLFPGYFILLNSISI